MLTMNCALPFHSSWVIRSRSVSDPLRMAPREMSLPAGGGGGGVVPTGVVSLTEKKRGLPSSMVSNGVAPPTATPL